MRAQGWVVGFVLVLGIAACGTEEEPVMPDVTGERLDVALSDIERAGFAGDVDVLGGGLLGVVDESNWEVCVQEPSAGSSVTETPRVTVDRSCGSQESEAADSPGASAEESSEEGAPGDGTADSGGLSDGAPAAAMTIENSPDLAALLAEADPCSATIGTFAAENRGREIEFDASIRSMGKHGNFETRFDILVLAGDFSESSALGPSFLFRDVNTVGDLNYVGTDLPDVIGVGDHLRITAVVEEYEEISCLFLLDPVATEFR